MPAFRKALALLACLAVALALGRPSPATAGLRATGDVKPDDVKPDMEGSVRVNRPRPDTTIRPRVHVPIVTTAGAPGCQPVPGASYQSLTVEPPPSDRPAEAHADLNLALRGYVQTAGVLGLVDYGGGNDAAAPQLYTLFGDRRTPAFQGVFQVYDWDWGCNCRGSAIGAPGVTLARLATAAGEIIATPESGYQIGRLSAGFTALVLYASPERLTIKYTREDNVVLGYTIHLEDICVEPGLLALYQAVNAAGRSSLPALRPGQPLGRARGDAIGVAIRDNGSFLDPRSRKDWWKGR